MRTYKTPVKASKLIEALKKGPFRAKVVDEGDLPPVFKSVDIEVGEDHICSITGSYRYNEDTVKCGVAPGRSEISILGVVFSKPIMDAEYETVEISVREIAYDGRLTEKDVIRVADKRLKFPGYDPDDFLFEPEKVDDDDLREAILKAMPEGSYALDASGRICCFEDDEVPTQGYRKISREEAADKFVADRASIDFD